MTVVCLDMEGVLVPEIWITFAQKTGLTEFKITTREEPDYDKLMNYRICLLRKYGMSLKAVTDVIDNIDPLPGAVEFVSKLRKEMQVLILSDTFGAFAKPIIKKLGWPFIFHNDLLVSSDGYISGYRLRSRHTKLDTVRGLTACGGVDVIAVGDSYNDLEMLSAARAGFFFNPPRKIIEENPGMQVFDDYDDLIKAICLAAESFNI